MSGSPQDGRAPPTRPSSSVSLTRSSRPNRWTNGRKSLRQSRISSGRRSTPSRTSWPTSNSTRREAWCMCRTETLGVTHGGDACRFPRHAVGAALGRAATRPTHRGDSRRTPKRDLYRLRQYCHAVRVTVELEAVARPDVDLTDGTFYAGHSHTAYQWMRTHQPVFRDRNGLAGAASYRAVLDAERNPELFSSARRHPSQSCAADTADDRHGRSRRRRRKLVNARSSAGHRRCTAVAACEPRQRTRLNAGCLHTDQTTWRKHMFSEELTTNGDQRHRPTARR